MSGVLTAIGAGLQIAGGMINMYRSSPPISVYRGAITRGFLEAWINNAKAFRAKQPPIYPYENEITELRVPDEYVLERLEYWLNDYNRKIVEEWGDESSLDVNAYKSLRFYPHLYKFLLNEEAHMNENHLYVVSNGDKLPITSIELISIARQNLNYDNFVNEVVAKIRQNLASIQATDSGDFDSNGTSSSGITPSHFNSTNLIFGGIVAYILFNFLKK